MTYLFEGTDGRFIINDERSKLGYAYPRIFIERKSTDEFINCDLTIGGFFNMPKGDFESWIDGSEVTDAHFPDVCADIGLRSDALMQMIDEIQAVA